MSTTRMMVKHEATRDTGLFGNILSKFCVLSTGEIVICDTEFFLEWKIHICDKTGTLTGKQIEGTCKHDITWHGIHMLPVTINGVEYIAVSCRMCNNIRLVDPRDPSKEPVEAYRGGVEEIGPMCLGPAGTLCIVGYLTGKVSIVDIDSIPFAMRQRLPEIINKWSDNICYVEDHDLIVLSSQLDKRIRGIRSTGSYIVWDVSPEINNKKFKPHGLAYVPDQDLLLVGDSYGKRMLVLSVSTGEVLQVIPLQEVTGLIRDLHLVDDKLIVWHSGGKLSFYTISCFSQKPDSRSKSQRREDSSFEQVLLPNEEILSSAYRDVCAKETTRNCRARVNVVGHPDAGASTFIQQLMGETTGGKGQSGEGIQIHSVEVKHIPHMTETWKEQDEADIDKITESFNKLLLFTIQEMQRNEPSPKSTAAATGVQTATSLSSRAREGFQSYFRNSTKQKEMDHDRTFLSIWDFDSQDKFLVSNQLFLDPQAVTLVVLDASKALHKPLHETVEESRSIPETPAEFLCYFLETLHSKTSEMIGQPKVALVLTQTQKTSKEDREEHMKRYIEDIQHYLHGRPYEAWITEENIFIEDDKPENLNKIRNEIFRMITTQESWKAEIPVRWSQLKADIMDSAPRGSAKYVYISAVAKLAEKYGMHEDEMESFLEFHHFIGSYIYYPDPGLRDVVTTDPQWLLDMMKKLLTGLDNLGIREASPDDLANLTQGITTEKMLQILWEGNDIQFLTNLMTNLHIMVPLHSSDAKEKSFVIPSLLPRSAQSAKPVEQLPNMAEIYSSLLDVPKKIAINTYHRLMCIFGNEPDWNLSKDKLSHDDVSLIVDDVITLAMTLLKDHIKLTAWSDIGMKYETLQDTLQNILKTLSASLEKAGIPENKSFQILCPHSAAGDDCIIKINMTKTPDDQEVVYLPEESMCPVHKEDLSPKDFKKFHPDKIELKEPKPKFPWFIKSASVVPCGEEMDVDTDVKREVLPLNVDENRTVKPEPSGSSDLKEEPMELSASFKELQLTEDDVTDKSDTDDEDLDVPTLFSLALETLEHFVQIVRVLKGESCTIQGENSDVKLHVPEGVHGAVLGRIHTIHSKFLHLIPDSECIVGPMCEYSIHPFTNGPQIHSTAKFLLQIPHIVNDLSKHKSQIRVRHIDSSTKEVILVPTDSKFGTRFDIDEQYINIHTSHFSTFLVTAENINCCAGSANVLLYGSLKNIPNTKPLTTVKVYFSSGQSKIEDYEDAITRTEVTCGRKLVEKMEIHLTKKPYYPKKSRAEMTLKAESDDNWKEDHKTKLYIKKKLTRFLNFDEEGHLCKRPPKEVAVFYMTSSKSFEPNFHRVLDIDLDIARQNTKKEKYPNKLSSSSVVIDLIDEKPMKTISKNDERAAKRHRTKKKTPSASHADQDQASSSKSRDISDRTAKASFDLTDVLINTLADSMSSTDMEKIAVAKLGFKFHRVDTLKSEGHLGSRLNKEILLRWRKKGPENTKMKLATLLYEAAEDGHGDWRVPHEVLGISKDECHS